LWDMFNKIKKWNISKRVMFLHMKDYIIWILAIEIAYKFDWWLNTTNFYIFCWRQWIFPWSTGNTTRLFLYVWLNEYT
jgi:hypothetical protein